MNVHVQISLAEHKGRQLQPQAHVQRALWELAQQGSIETITVGPATHVCCRLQPEAQVQRAQRRHCRAHGVADNIPRLPWILQAEQMSELMQVALHGI